MIRFSVLGWKGRREGDREREQEGEIEAERGRETMKEGGNKGRGRERDTGSLVHNFFPSMLFV